MLQRGKKAFNKEEAVAKTTLVRLSQQPQPTQEILFPFGCLSSTNKVSPDAKCNVVLVLGTNEGINQSKYGLLEQRKLPAPSSNKQVVFQDQIFQNTCSF